MNKFHQPKYLQDSEAHLLKCHERWMQRAFNRPEEFQNEQEEAYWLPRQCLHCRYYVTLSGAFSLDWGICSHPESDFDGKLMFEHDGCEIWDPVDP